MKAILCHRSVEDQGNFTLLAEREELLTMLVDLWKFGYNYGRIEVGIPAAITAYVRSVK